MFFEFCCVSIDRRKYKYQKVKGECDFIIGCKNSIIIIEAKKKVLTIKSKSEQNYNIFSYVNPIVQFVELIKLSKKAQ